jgi:tetratricopeptide (TPR) repeat protein
MKKLLLILLCLPMIGFGQTAEDYYNKAEDFKNNGKYQLAIDNYSECLKLEPNYGEYNGFLIYNLRGFSYYQLADYKKAIADFSTSIELKPDEDVVYQNIINASINLEKDCKKPTKPKKYNSRQSQEEFELTEKYQTYLNELDLWKHCRQTINNYRLYSRKMQIDNETGLVMIDNITKAEGISKDELYSNAKVWLASFFNSATDVIKLDDKENGIIISKGLFAFEWKGGLFKMNYYSNCYFTLKIYCKEGRFRVIWTDFKFDIMQNLIKVSANDMLLNPYKLEGASNINTADGFTPDGQWSSQKESVLRSIDIFNYNITKALTQKRVSLGDDW